LFVPEAGFKSLGHDDFFAIRIDSPGRVAGIDHQPGVLDDLWKTIGAVIGNDMDSAVFFSFIVPFFAIASGRWDGFLSAVRQPGTKIAERVLQLSAQKGFSFIGYIRVLKMPSLKERLPATQFPVFGLELVHGTDQFCGIAGDHRIGGNVPAYH
jgi:hypothetical protein